MDLTTTKREPLELSNAEDEGINLCVENNTSSFGIITEFSDCSSTVDQSAGSTKTETISIKEEPGSPGEEYTGEISYTDIVIDQQDIKKECLEYSERVSQTADSQPIAQETEEDQHNYFPTFHQSESKKEFKKTISHSASNKQPSIRTKAKAFACNQCNSVFGWKKQLEIHSLVHTGEKPFACSQCSSVFNQKSNWKTHMLTHSGDKPFACPHCTAAFSRKSTLKTHFLQHTGEKPFVCAECNAAFAHEISLKTHILSHYGLKPFQCNQCSSAFTRKTGLDRHILTHSGVKPFRCVQCNSVFTQKSSLKTHMLSHSGVKPFACYLCSFTCSVGISLKRHILTHTGEKPFSCPLCDYVCSQKSRLKNHIRRHNEKSQKNAQKSNGLPRRVSPDPLSLVDDGQANPPLKPEHTSPDEPKHPR